MNKNTANISLWPCWRESHSSDALETALTDARKKKSYFFEAVLFYFVTNLPSISSFQVFLLWAIICFVTCKALFSKPADVIKTEDYKVMKCVVEARYRLDVFVRGLLNFVNRSELELFWWKFCRAGYETSDPGAEVELHLSQVPVSSRASCSWFGVTT